MKKYNSKDILFVGFQLLLMTTYFFPLIDISFFLNTMLRYIALIFAITGILMIVIAILQLNKNLTPFPTPKENGNLISNGLYKYIRHPIYSGIIISAIAFGVFDLSVWKITIGIQLLFLFFFKSKYEERMLTKHFPEYSDYIKTTKRFFPFL